MYTDKNGTVWYKVQLHAHTNLSDGGLSPEKVAARYRDAGFDAIAITDHWKTWQGGDLEGITVISGCEYDMGGRDSAGGVMHILGLGMKEQAGVEWPGDSWQTVIDKIRAKGGLAVLAHPAWSLNTVEQIKGLNGFSMIEIYNAVSDAHQSSRPYSGHIIDVLANDGIVFPLIATDDAHYYDGTDDARGYIMVKAAGNSAEDILNAVVRGDFYATQGPELYVRRDGDTIVVDCSPCVKIDFLSSSVYEKDRIIRGEDLTHAEYKIKDHEKWVRVEVLDANGNYAWSSIFDLR